MASLTKRITKTTTTTSSASSARIIGGEDVDGVGRVEDGRAIMFRGGEAREQLPYAHSRRFEPTHTTGDDGDVEDMMEPDIADTSHMQFVDGRCSCCPYGYHVDLDFLQYLNSLNSGEYLHDLKKIHHDKAHLRSSMESYLEEQERARRSGFPGAGVPPSDDFRSTLEKENRASRRVVEELDNKTVGQLTTYDHGTGPVRQVLSDGTNRGPDITYDKTYKETIEVRRVRHPRNQDFDSGSSLSMSSGPSSPTGHYSSPPGLESHLPPSSGGRYVTETTVTTSSTTSPKNRLAQLEQQLKEITPVPQSDHLQRTYVNSMEFASNMATIRTQDERDRATPTNENVNGTGRPPGHGGPPGGTPFRPGRGPGREDPDRPGRGPDGLGRGGPDGPGRGGPGTGGTVTQFDLTEIDRLTSGKLGQDQGDTAEMTRINAATLQAIREQMAASLQRMHELEEQVKAIPVLQVRNSVLKEEKRMLEMQLQSKSGQLRNTGVGDFTVDESDFDERSEFSTYRRYLHSGGEDEHRRTTAGSRTDEEGPDGVYRSTTTVSVGYGPDGEPIPVRIHEKELKTEENTEIREKEVKTIFLGGSDDGLTSDLNERPGRAPKSTMRPVKKDVRSIGVGEGNVFDGSSSMEVHQKELRTVYIGDTGKEFKSTRNVGILCKPAMRDVGMVHMIDSERPMIRTIAVGVGEIGCGFGGGGGEGEYYSGEEGSEGALVSMGAGDGGVGVGGGQMMNAAMSHMMMTSYQSRRTGLGNDQLRSLLDEMLKRTVHSVAIQCSFSTDDKSVDTSGVYEKVDVACSDDVVDVDVVPIRQMKSVAIDNRPSLFHRACGTDYVYKIDMATNTQTLGIRHHRSTNTDTAVTYPAATNTDDPVRDSTSTNTDKSVFYALEQIANVGTNTNIQEFWNVEQNTELSGDVQELVIKPEVKDISMNTTTSAVRVSDKMINTTQNQCVEKAMNTTGVQQFARGVNTDKPRVSAAAVNTDRNAFVSKGVDCNIIQPEKKPFGSSLDEGSSQTSHSSEITRTVRSSTTEARQPTERQEVRTSTTEQREVVPSTRGVTSHVYSTQSGSRLGDVSSADSRDGGERSEFEEVTSGSGGRTVTTTRVVKTSSRGGSDFPFGDTGLQRTSGISEGLSGLGGTTTRTVTTVTRGGRSQITDDFPAGELGLQRTAGFSEGLSGVGGSSSTRTVTTVTRGGRSETTGDFPVSTGSTSFQDSTKEQVTGSSTRSQDALKSTELEEGFGSGGSGGRSSTTRTVTRITRGGRSGLSEDFPELRKEVGLIGTEGPEFDESFSTESSGGRTVTTRTIRSTTRGGRSEITDDFPEGHISFREGGEGLLGSAGRDGSGGQRSVTTRTVRRSYRTGGDEPDSFSSQGLVSGSGARTMISGGESHLVSRMDEDLDRLKMLRDVELGGSRGGGSGYSSSRTVIKRTSGDPNDPESWHEETWVEGGAGEGSTSRQITESSSSQSEAVEVPQQSSTTTSEIKISGTTSSSSSSSSTSATKSEEPLKSIMKTSRQTERFASGRKGITFSESAESKFEVSQELESACNIYDQWLEDSTLVTAKQLNSSMAAIQKEWFKVSSHKLSALSHVEGFLNIVNDLSPDLLKQVINMTDTNGNSALHYAVSNLNADIVNLVLDTGVSDINLPNNTGCTAVMMAALIDLKTERQREVIRRLFQLGDVNLQASGNESVSIELAGQTALMLAVSHGRLDMVKMLLDADANVNLQDEDGSTALMVAAEHGHVDIARLLLSHPECDALVADKEGSTAMSIAKEEGRQSIVSLLNAHLNLKSSRPESYAASRHKARKTVTRITLSSPTEMS